MPNNSLSVANSFSTYVRQFESKSEKTLVIRDPQDCSIIWALHIGREGLYYATSYLGNREQTERVRCLFKLCQPNLPHLLSNRLLSGLNCEYSFLYQQCLQSSFSVSEFRRLLENFTLEALIQIMSIPNPQIEVQNLQLAEPIFITLPLTETISKLQKYANTWQCWRPHIPSPFVRLYLDYQKIYQYSELVEKQKNSLQSEKFLLKMLPLLKHKVSLYQAATEFNTQPVNLAGWLIPLIKSGLISTLASPQLNTDKLIACVDDSLVIQLAVKRTLETAGGYKVIGITRAEEALSKLSVERPALVITDINMPGIDGYELCRRLRQTTYLKSVPIIMLTGRDGVLDQLRARLVGVTKYLVKPFEPKQLLTIVKQVSL